MCFEELDPMVPITLLTNGKKMIRFFISKCLWNYLIKMLQLGWGVRWGGEVGGHSEPILRVRPNCSVSQV